MTGISSADIMQLTRCVDSKQATNVHEAIAKFRLAIDDYAQKVQIAYDLLSIKQKNHQELNNNQSNHDTGNLTNLKSQLTQLKVDIQYLSDNLNSMIPQTELTKMEAEYNRLKSAADKLFPITPK